MTHTSRLPGLHVIGANTVGENIADNAGIAIALKAYHISLGGKPAPVIDGLTGDQRFYLSFGQIWRTKQRDSSLRTQTFRTSTARRNSASSGPPATRMNGMPPSTCSRVTNITCRRISGCICGDQRRLRIS